MQPNRLKQSNGPGFCEVTLQSDRSTSVWFSGDANVEEKFFWEDHQTETEARHYLSRKVAELLENGYMLVNGDDEPDNAAACSAAASGSHPLKRKQPDSDKSDTEPDCPQMDVDPQPTKKPKTGERDVKNSPKVSPPASPDSGSSTAGGGPPALSDLKENESAKVQSQSSSSVYIIKNTGGGVYTCSCPAWRIQKMPVNERTCKHLKEFRGDAAEAYRLSAVKGSTAPTSSSAASVNKAKASSSKPAPSKPTFEVMLAHKWEETQDPTGYWMSEKLDGMRAYWNGKELLSRQGNVLMAPQEFLQGFPADLHLDGEIFLGRGNFQELMSVVKNSASTMKSWSKAKYIVFDAPELSAPFEERIETLTKALEKAKAAHAIVHPHTLCKSKEHLLEELKRVQDLGGEGMMIRQPKSAYSKGRSKALLKVKTFLDGEAKVIGHEPGKGKYVGMTGALLCRAKDGSTFKVGTGMDDKTRSKPPRVGEIITYRYFELTKDGKPRFPSYVGVRADPDPFP